MTPMKLPAWSTCLLALLLAWPARAAEVPAELAGHVSGFEAAWSLSGFSEQATVIGLDGDRGPELLVGGPRGAATAPRLGDLSLLSLDGYARRRLTAQSGLVGLPALVGGLAVGAEAAGGCTFWFLSRRGLENTPRRWPAAEGGLVGPVILGDLVLLSSGPRVEAISRSLEALWTVELPVTVTVGLGVDTERAFAAGAGRLTALDLATGDEAWATELPTVPSSDLLVSAGVVIAALADGTIHGYDAETGDEVWVNQLAPATLSPHPALAGPWAIYSASTGQLTALDTATGEIGWQANGPGPLSSPTVGYGRVFVTTGDGRLAAVPFDANQETLLTEGRNAEGALVSLVGEPCLIDGRVYVAGSGGVLCAFNLVEATGASDWPLPGGGPNRAGHSLPAEAWPEPAAEGEPAAQEPAAEEPAVEEPAEPTEPVAEPEPVEPPAEPAPVEPAPVEPPAEPVPPAG
ncbi:MAG TPA: hypothetical protein DCZ72_10935 [Armatimonadetes bacterium]|nr:hypothetical protein [Armatimonadota bacterium]